MRMAAGDDEDEEQEAQLERAPSRRIGRDQPALSKEQVIKSSLSI